MLYKISKNQRSKLILLYIALIRCCYCTNIPLCLNHSEFKKQIINWVKLVSDNRTSESFLISDSKISDSDVVWVRSCSGFKKVQKTVIFWIRPVSDNQTLFWIVLNLRYLKISHLVWVRSCSGFKKVQKKSIFWTKPVWDPDQLRTIQKILRLSLRFCVPTGICFKIILNCYPIISLL